MQRLVSYSRLIARVLGVGLWLTWVPFLHAQENEDWGEWARDTDPLNHLQGLEIDPDIRNTLMLTEPLLQEHLVPEDDKGTHEPLDAQEQAIVNALDNSDLSDYATSSTEDLENLDDKLTDESILDKLDAVPSPE
ncbi:hypothetical protein SAMN05421831_10673 [Allopseudospirillum japonicum]|uniref:Uncharacterized protein n=1 Tax=Allopseudospirillum japonicum TaxID=64971 RepID=A0A1H6SLQ6_9GAMM|nr:hypothetical protein [Allopseudospirillum japonicum]SEI64492.1 hypothetical protein SAMN05421831_10673 [Allopseudospirillum japonicum]